MLLMRQQLYWNFVSIANEWLSISCCSNYIQTCALTTDSCTSCRTIRQILFFAANKFYIEFLSWFAAKNDIWVCLTDLQVLCIYVLFIQRDLSNERYNKLIQSNERRGICRCWGNNCIEISLNNFLNSQWMDHIQTCDFAADSITRCRTIKQISFFVANKFYIEFLPLFAAKNDICVMCMSYCSSETLYMGKNDQKKQYFFIFRFLVM